jgi:hypothetical protein
MSLNLPEILICVLITIVILGASAGIIHKVNAIGRYTKAENLCFDVTGKFEHMYKGNTIYCKQSDGKLIKLPKDSS